MIETLQSFIAPRFAIQLMLLIIAGSLFNIARKLK